MKGKDEGSRICITPVGCYVKLYGTGGQRQVGPAVPTACVTVCSGAVRSVGVYERLKIVGGKGGVAVKICCVGMVLRGPV